MRRRFATLWNDDLVVQSVSADADRWFTEYLGVSCSIVVMPDNTRRQVDTTYAPFGRIVGFADGFPVLVIGSASLDELNRRLRAKGVPPVGIERFRPNVVVSGGAPHEEDSWSRLEGADVALDIVKPCARCTIVATDQESGVRVREPLATLAEYRRLGNNVLFGQNALHDRTGRISVGDTLAVRSRDVARDGNGARA
jgi:uncharacterized protein YcbX